MIELRPYQSDAIQRLRDKFQEGFKSVVLVMPTGSGKTIVASNIMAGAIRQGSRLLFTAHRRELIAQTYAKMLDFGVPEDQLGVVMGDGRIRVRGREVKAIRREAQIQIASIDTLRHRRLPPADIVFIDEAHRALSPSYMALKQGYPHAIHVGLTATPYRSGGKGLGSYYDALVVGATPSLLMEQGFIVKPRVRTVPPDQLPDLEGIKVRNGDYDEKELAEACNKRQLVGSIVDHWRQLAEGRRTVCFPVSIEHSKHIVADFVAANIPAEHLDGTTPKDQRDAMLGRLERGETLIVSSCGVLSEGWDQPSVKCAILARPTKSTGLYLQQAGRILRPWSNVSALILDHAGMVVEHEPPWIDRDFTLEDTKAARRSSVSTKTCLSCFAVVEPFHTTCPECGVPFPTEAREGSERGKVEHVEGTLVEYGDDRVREKRDYYDQLCELARQYNYKPGWAAHRFKEKYGHWPPKSYPKQPGRPMTDGERDVLRASLQRVAQQRGLPGAWVESKVAAAAPAPTPIPPSNPTTPTQERLFDDPNPT